MSFSAAFAPDVAIITVSDHSESSRWLRHIDCEHVELGVRGLGRRNVWAARLDEVVYSTRRKVVLVTESVSCFAVAWWARLSPTAYVADVVGALLLDPLGTGAAAPSLNLKHFAAPSTPLPFASILYTDARTAEAGAQAATLATSWGSRFAHDSALDLIAAGEGCASDTEHGLARLLAELVRGPVVGTGAMPVATVPVFVAPPLTR
jgi:predicted alpha/beta hydrolase family esterase